MRASHLAEGEIIRTRIVCTDYSLPRRSRPSRAYKIGIAVNGGGVIASHTRMCIDGKMTDGLTRWNWGGDAVVFDITRRGGRSWAGAGVTTSMFASSY